MVGEVLGAIQAIKSASDAAKSLVELRDIALMREKAAELKLEILNALDLALEARSREEALLSENRELKQEIAQLKKWNADANQYEMQSVGPGAFAYVRKLDAQPIEKPHWLCVKCFDEHKRSVLQYAGRTENKNNAVYRCATCRSQIQVHYSRNPETHADAMMSEQSNSKPEVLTPVKCPYCRSGTKLVIEEDHPDFGEMGFKQHTLECVACHKQISRMFDPRSGYTDEKTHNWESSYITARR